MRRVVAIALSSLRLVLARQRDAALEDAPLAVVVLRNEARLERAGGEDGERAILGNTRLDEVDLRAASEGIRPGDTVAQARAKLAELSVRVVAERDAQAALESLAEIMLAFGATTSILRDRDTIAIDVTGCAHLHPKVPGEAVAGETTLAERIAACVQSLGYEGTVAIADGPERAWALARFVADPRHVDPARRIVIVAPGEERSATAALSVSALRLDDATTSFFVRLGVRTLGDLVKLPRSSLAARLGPDARRVFALLDGRDATPLVRHEPKETIAERVELEYGVESLPPILFVIKSLAARVASRLAARVKSAARLRIELGLDAALLPAEARDAKTAVIELPLPLPLHREGELFAVLRARLERDGTANLKAPVLSVTFLVPELVARDAKERALFRSEARAETALAPLVAELGALLGDGAVGKLVPIGRWNADARSKLVPLPHKRRKVREASAPEPLRWLREPEPCPAATPVAHLLRTESVEWWREQSPPPCDRLLATIDGALAVIEVDARGVHLRGFAD